MPEFSFSSTAEDVTDGVDLSGKTVLITGVNSGIGEESARVLSSRGAFIIGLARTEEKASSAIKAMSAEGAGVACDLSEPATVRAAVEAVRGLGRKLDVIMCNAGIMALPERQVKHGLELQFLTNHVGHFILVQGLVDELAADGRVVVTSSAAHRMGPEEGIVFDDLSGEKTYAGWRQYGQSKLANILFAKELHRRFEGTERLAVSLHPGVIKTNLGRHDQESVDAMIENMDPSSVKTIGQGAATQCLLAARPEITPEIGGQYWADCQPAKLKGPAVDDDMARKLWTTTEALVAEL